MDLICKWCILLSEGQVTVWMSVSQSFKCRIVVGELGHHMAQSSTGMLNSKKSLQKLLNGYRGSFWGDESIAELDTANGCATL